MTANEPRVEPVCDCEDCPFAREVRGVGLTCRHLRAPEEPDNIVEGGELPPSWCPLRERPTLVRLETNDAR